MLVVVDVVMDVETETVVIFLVEEEVVVVETMAVLVEIAAVVIVAVVNRRNVTIVENSVMLKTTVGTSRANQHMHIK